MASKNRQTHNKKRTKLLLWFPFIILYFPLLILLGGKKTDKIGLWIIDID